MADSAGSASGGEAQGIDLFEQVMQGGAADSAPAEQALEENNPIPEGETPEEILAEAGDEEIPEQEEQEQEPEEEKEEEKEAGSRAQKRIQQLNAKNKELQTQLAEERAAIEQRFAQERRGLQAAMAQQQAYIQQMYQAVEAQRADMESLRQVRAQDEEKNLSEFERFKRAQLREAETLAQKQIQAAIEPLQKQLEEQALARQRAQETWEKQQRFRTFKDQAQRAIRGTILSGAEEKEFGDLGDPTEEMLLAWSAASGELPEKAAARFNQYLDKLVDLKQRLRAKKAGESVKKGKALPATSQASRKGGTGSVEKLATPSKAQLLANGFETLWEYRRKGSPALRKS